MPEKRKNLLLFLQDGHKDMRDILRSPGTTRQSLLPQVRIFEDRQLARRSGHIYELITVAERIVEK
ncbi:MAG: hypothetical protein JW705_06765 [Methanosarcinaceae archaeon]|nr:hypothetical protein [Methanosarcinaceae archaeon]